MPTPNLGYGKQTEASIDQVNQWMRSQPWYQQIRGNSPKLNDSQRRQILRAAQAQGVVVDEGNMEVDPSGNFNPKGHKLRNTLIVAGIAGATIATMGAAGAFSGAAGAGAGAGAGAAGVGGAAAPLAAGSFPGVVAGLGTAGATGTAAATGGAGILGAAGKFLSGGKGLAGYLDTAGAIGSALGAAGEGRAAGRLAEGNANSQYDRNAIDLYRVQSDANNQKNNFGLNRVNAGVSLSNADLDRRKYALAAPGARAGNAVRGDILANAQDVSISGLPAGRTPVQFNGGLRPSMFSADTRALGANMSHQARTEQEAGDHFDALPSLPDYIDGPDAPGLTPLPQSGKLDSILNTAGTIGNIGNLISTLPYKRKVNNTGTTDDTYAYGG